MSSQLPNTGQTYEALHAQWEQSKDLLPEGLQLRTYRGLSWIARAEMEQEDEDAAFIFYWIAFNAIYAEDRLEVEEMPERRIFERYFRKIAKLDSDNVIYDALWNRFSQEIRVFLDNHFVFQPFWKHHNGLMGYEDWSAMFEASKRQVNAAMAQQDVVGVLSTLFDRLYVLRNQLIHGGATWRSSVNREQVRDGRRIVAFLVPRFVQIMVANPHEPWGAPYYPVVARD